MAFALYRLVRRELDEFFYYNTRYGSPLAYLRPIELLAAHGVKDLDGVHLMDFGYGTVGHLRLLATLGAEVVGVEVDPMLRALYSQPGDQGKVGAKGGNSSWSTASGPRPRRCATRRGAIST
jgi:hypothetical protein